MYSFHQPINRKELKRHCCDAVLHKPVYLFYKLLDIFFFFLIKINTKWKSKTNLHRVIQRIQQGRNLIREQSSAHCQFQRILYSGDVWLKHDYVKLLFVYNTKHRLWFTYYKNHAGCLLLFFYLQNNSYRTYSHTHTKAMNIFCMKRISFHFVQHNNILYYETYKKALSKTLIYHLEWWLSCCVIIGITRGVKCN